MHASYVSPLWRKDKIKINWLPIGFFKQAFITPEGCRLVVEVVARETSELKDSGLAFADDESSERDRRIAGNVCQRTEQSP